MNDYDIFIVPDFKLDVNYNYTIKLVTSINLNNQDLLDKFDEFNIVVDTDFKHSYTKIVYFTDVSCLVDIKQWLLQLNNELNALSLKTNLDSILHKELKK